MKIKGLRWWILSLIAFATVINYVDRNALGMMWPAIYKDIGLDKADGKNAYAMISSFFLIAYALSKGLSGRLFDIIGTRVGFVISIVVWSLSATLHGIARGVVSFSVFRAILGLGEAGNWPGATKSNAEWFPVKERALAQGIFNTGASVGAIISAPLISMTFVMVGWKMTFILMGLLGLLWVIPWLWLNRGTPSKHAFITEEERKYIIGGHSVKNKNDQQTGLSYKQLFKYRESWAIMLSRFFIDPIWWLFVIWLPIYLNDTFGFNVKEIGFFAWVPYVGATLGAIFGGWLAKKMIAKGISIGKVRKGIIGFAGIVMVPGLIFGAFTNEPIMAVILIAVVLFGFQMAIGNLQTLPSDYFSEKSVGTLAGMGEFSAALGSIILSTFLIPALSKVSYVPVFILGATLVPLAFISIITLGGEIKRLNIKSQINHKH